MHMNLTNMPSYREEYYGVHYPAMWNYLVSYLESPADDDAQKHVDELLKWWNK